MKKIYLEKNIDAFMIGIVIELLASWYYAGNRCWNDRFFYLTGKKFVFQEYWWHTQGSIIVKKSILISIFLDKTSQENLS